MCAPVVSRSLGPLMSNDDRGLIEGMLSNCEQEVRTLGRMLDERTRELVTLRGQLAVKERANQRLVVVLAEQAAEVERLAAELRAQEAAASV